MTLDLVSRGTSEFVVEPNVPIPPRSQAGRANGRARMGRPRVRYPFATMNVGDSFAYPVTEHTRVASAASHHAREHFVRFFVSRLHLRCWRVA